MVVALYSDAGQHNVKC